MIHPREADAIYEAFLAGSTVAELARKYHHRRRTIETLVRCMGRLAQVKVGQLQQTCQIVADERDRLFATAMHREFAFRSEQEGVEAAEGWLAQYRDGMKALFAKHKALPGIVRHVFDEKGLVVDVVGRKGESTPDVTTN